MNEQQLQQAFIQYLAQKLGVQSEQELEQAIQQMGEEGLKQAYAEFMQLMQQQQVQAAKFGAKVGYLKHLKCPDCEKKKVEKDKCGKKMSIGGDIESAKCGKKWKPKKKK